MMGRQEIIANYKAHYNHSMGRMLHLADVPVEMTAKGSYIIDGEGQKYLDLCSGYGVHSLGHGNDSIKTEAVEQLLALPMIPACFQHDARERFLKRVIDLMPEGLNQVFISNSGSEAMEIALRTLLLNASDKKQIIAVTNGYHGKSLGALSVLGQTTLRCGFEPLLTDVKFIPFGDINEARRSINKDTLAFVVEPILGGGYLEEPPEGYLKTVSKLCAETDTFARY